MPKFNEGKNPFAAKPVESTPAEPLPGNPAASAPATVRKASSQFVAPPTVKSPAKAAGLPVAKAAGSGWTTRLNPFRPPASAEPPVVEQTELSLHAVKVVHNDLADADVEIVPVRTHASLAEAPVLPPTRHAWEFLGERMVKAG